MKLHSTTTMLIITLIGISVITTATNAKADQPYITLSSTTSTKNSGLYDYLLPKFTKVMNIEVRVVSMGTGKAIRIAQAGDADVLLVHHKPSEEKFVSEGYGIERFDVMYNDFVLIGPKQDPANVANEKDIVFALQKISKSSHPFISRGDESGTNMKERALWVAAKIDATSESGEWYRETGSGMGATLNVAAAMNGYVLSDRATWLNFNNKATLTILVEGDMRLFNQYGVILINKDRHPHTKSELAQIFINWITGPKGQYYIGNYKINGQQAFFPNAKTEP